MMAVCQSSNQNNSLFTAMSRFITAVNNMDQTVMVPSLLRDVPLDHSAQPLHHDMYASYVLLKSIRNHMEWGGQRDKDHETEQDDLEKQFHFHLDGLQAVLSKLTLAADTLTSRYKDQVGCRK